jgi:hypothetical protein
VLGHHEGDVRAAMSQLRQPQHPQVEAAREMATIAAPDGDHSVSLS